MSPTRVDFKKIYKTHDVSSRTQIKSVYSGEHIKLKLSTNYSKYILTLTLKLKIAVNINGFNVKTESKCADEKHTFEMHTTSPRAQIATDRRDDHIKRKPLASSSTSTRVLMANLMFSLTKTGLEPRYVVH